MQWKLWKYLALEGPFRTISMFPAPFAIPLFQRIHITETPSQSMSFENQFLMSLGHISKAQNEFMV